ncbi:unnamed protein product [Larinioides sclopetarius]|uniref:Uncharacterized protein n=1 Tax=Larinioides sclopetarius TaxID=280406 RepID=A0AAV2AH93_9ARAC
MVSIRMTTTPANKNSNIFEYNKDSSGIRLWKKSCTNSLNLSGRHLMEPRKNSTSSQPVRPLYSSRF